MPNEKGLWFDTVVLSNFLFADALPWLIERYPRRIYVPSEVIGEVARGIASGHYELKAFYSYLGPGKITHYPLNEKEHEKTVDLRRYLGAGEASCIVCARFHGGIVVTDDRRARAACRDNGLSFTGTIGILASSCIGAGLSVEDADAMLEKMKARGFYSPVSSIKDIV
jgi:predicted nucleic acid-binding protein